MIQIKNEIKKAKKRSLLDVLGLIKFRSFFSIYPINLCAY